MTKPYDQDAEDLGIPEPAAEEAMIAVLEAAGAIDHPVQRRPSTLHSIVSHLRRYWELYMAVIILLLLSFVLGYGYARETAVCHAATEDSIITDCDFDDGEWTER